jgi:hypothetical protein
VAEEEHGGRVDGMGLGEEGDGCEVVSERIRSGVGLWRTWAGMVLSVEGA